MRVPWRSQSQQAKTQAELARTYRAAGDLDGATRILLEGIREHPSDLALMTELAEVAIAKKDWPAAALGWTQILDAYGARPPAGVFIRAAFVFRNAGYYLTDQKPLETVSDQASFSQTGSAGRLASIIGLVILMANGFWLTMAFGIVGARYRDLSQITAAIMRIAFLATPVIWFAHGARGGSLGVFLILNPFYHFLDIVRAPLLGYPIEATTWIAVLLITAGGFGLTIYLYKRYSSLVPLWV